MVPPLTVFPPPIYNVQAMIPSEEGNRVPPLTVFPSPIRDDIRTRQNRLVIIVSAILSDIKHYIVSRHTPPNIHYWDSTLPTLFPNTIGWEIAQMYRMDSASPEAG